MDSLREGIQLQRIGQKDPLVEYKNEAYSMFVELMTNIKFEVLLNLFRSTSNLQAFEKFLASLPQTLLREAMTPPQRDQPQLPPATVQAPEEPPQLEIPARRELPRVGRNDVCPCGSGKKSKNCCGKMP